MKTVRIDKAKLIAILRANREDHRAVFIGAQEGYRTKAIAILDEQLALARSRQPFSLCTITSMVAPEDHTDDYDRIIQMLEMSVDTVIELTAQEFQKFVQDDWAWSQSWSISNSAYTSSPKFDKYR